MQSRNISGITTIGIATYRLRWCYQPVIRNHFSLRCYPVCPTLDIINLADRNTIEIHHVTFDVRFRRFLLEQETATGHTMCQRDWLHRQATVLVYDLLLSSINHVENHFIIKSMTEKSHLFVKHRLQSCRSIDIQLGCPSKQSECTNHSNKAKTMVAMEMTDKHSRKFSKADTGAPQLHLRSLSTIYHELLPP